MGDVDTEARERIAEVAGRLAAHERHCDERHANLRDFMAHIQRQTERINMRLLSIWRWIISVLCLLVVSLLGLMTDLLSRSLFT
ncbi:MAG: hypothetical protein KDC18_15720 [Alphaproteobacteria bacterium]|nr:hypothetical protein [Alphaproteobacteria bacterium]MCB9928879.1 hypothetical protein [Alphaproteobacteria bacterium]